MKFIKNYKEVASNNKRSVALKILESGLTAIQPENVLLRNYKHSDGVLYFQKTKINLNRFERVFLLGFGKGSAKVSQMLEKSLGKYLTSGMVIDTIRASFKKIEYVIGTHPLPSKANIDFTEKVLKKFENLTEKDIVLIVICGGGSALLEAPERTSLTKITKIFNSLINSGANIEEINVVRKHLSKVKGGRLAKHLYPARVINLIFSDVPGNDPSVIASGPTVRGKSTKRRAIKIIDEYRIDPKLLSADDLVELPKEDRYFENVSNILMLSNKIMLDAMSEEAEKLGFKSHIFSDRLTGNAKNIGKKLIGLTPPGKILLSGGETTLKVTGKGRGGRNQALVLSCIPVPDDTLVLSFASDGVDYYYYGGALADKDTYLKAKKLNLSPKEFLDKDDSYTFFNKTKDGLFSGKLGSNVSDIVMVLKI